MKKHKLTPTEYKIKFSIRKTCSDYTSNLQSFYTSKFNAQTLENQKELGIPLPRHTSEAIKKLKTEYGKGFTADARRKVMRTISCSKCRLNTEDEIEEDLSYESI